MGRPIFSQSWCNAAKLRPRLLPHARIFPQNCRGRHWFVLQDATNGRYHRLSPGAYVMVSRMDGMRTLQELWDEACNRGGDRIPTQDEAVELLMQLHSNDLLHCDVTPDSAELFERYRKHRNLKWKQWITQPMSLRIPLFDPDAFLTRQVRRLAWLFTLKGGLLWLAVVLPALLLAGQHWKALTHNLSDQVLSAGNLLVLALAFPAVKAIHELGHGFAAKVWGGQIHEMGLMFLVFTPIPYVDASASAAFRDKYQRVIVGAAGMMAEVFLAAMALYLWVLVEPGIVRAIAFNVMLIAGVSTIVINGNPLLRYDGYYILSDLIEMPNLGQRGQQYLTYCSDRYLFGAKEIESPDESLSEKCWLLGYTIASWCYRIFVTVAIILFVADKFFIFGVLLAIVATLGLLLRPVWKSFRHLMQSTTLHRHRSRTLRLSVIFAVVIISGGFFTPMPLRTQTEGVVWLPEQALVRAGVNGFFLRWLVEPGVQVNKGDALLVMHDPQLTAELALAEARVAEAEARYHAEQFTHPVQAGVLQQRLEHEKSACEQVRQRYRHLVVYSEVSGILTAPKYQDMAGQYFREGELLGYLMDRKLLVARVAVAQENIDLVRTRLKSVELRFVHALPDTYKVAVLREIPGASNELPAAALSPDGGGHIAVDAKLKTLDRVFFVDLSLPPEAIQCTFGGRVYVRFDHISEPLSEQIYRRLRQLFLSRFHV